MVALLCHLFLEVLRIVDTDHLKARLFNSSMPPLSWLEKLDSVSYSRLGNHCGRLCIQSFVSLPAVRKQI